jgi:carbon-monoxide dehydrogenase large subunit
MFMGKEEALDYIGISLPRLDGRDKVTGQAVYGTDVKSPGMLFAKALRSPYPHARILNIDTSKAEALTGVKAVITGKSFPFRPFGAAVRDTYFIAVDKVRFLGEPVAALAALDEDVAEEALGLIQVDYQELPAVFNPVEAMKPDAPLVHEELGSYGQAPYNKAIAGTNICNHFRLRKGDVNQGFAKSDLIMEETYTIHKLQHCPMETHASMAQVAPDGRLTVWSNTQTPHVIRLELAAAFGMPLNGIRVIATYVGGGFGAKREEEFLATVTRHPCQVTVKTGVNKDGTLVAREMVAIWDTGAYSQRGERVSRKAGYSAPGPYKMANIAVDSYCVYTNNVSAGAFRGFGDSQMTWAVEQHTDSIAERLGIDPIEFRLKDLYEEGTVSASGQVLKSVGLKDTILKTKESLAWKKFGKKDGRGLGIGCIHKNTAAGTSSSALITVNEDGTASVLTGAMEIGQGAKTALTQIAAQALGLPPESVNFCGVDTDVSPFDFGTVSSRITFSNGNAIILAAKEVRERIFEVAAEKLEANPADLDMARGRVFIRGTSERGMTIREMFSATSYQGVRRGYMMGRGTFMPDDEESLEWETGHSEKPTIFWMYGAQGAEVEVDRETGEVKVLKLVAAQDVGKAINPAICHAQLQGSLSFGIGASFLEEMVLEEGKVLNASFMDYLLPTALDLPDMETILVEVPHPEGPYGAKGFSDAAVCAVEAAIGNAIYQTAGVRVVDGPITPEKVWRALKQRGI